MQWQDAAGLTRAREQTGTATTAEGEVAVAGPAEFAGLRLVQARVCHGRADTPWKETGARATAD